MDLPTGGRSRGSRLLYSCHGCVHGHGANSFDVRYPCRLVPASAPPREMGKRCAITPCSTFRHESVICSNWRNSMKKLIVAAVAVAAIVATPAFAGDDMAGMNMSIKPSATKTSSNSALTDAEVKKVDPATGMVTLKHGALENVGMPPMTMAFKAKDAAMVKQVHEGDKVKVRVESVNGTLTIVKMEKQS